MYNIVINKQKRGDKMVIFQYQIQSKYEDSEWVSDGKIYGSLKEVRHQMLSYIEKNPNVDYRIIYTLSDWDVLEGYYHNRNEE